jgi:hypothetical protein
MSAPARHEATASPEELAGGPLVSADLGAFFANDEGPWSAILAAVGLRSSVGDSREALRAAIDAETRKRALAGCALVSTACTTAQAVDIEDPMLALILLSKSSNTIWVARKTPILDASTLARRISTRDARFRGAAR